MSIRSTNGHFLKVSQPTEIKPSQLMLSDGQVNIQGTGYLRYRDNEILEEIQWVNQVLARVFNIIDVYT